ncbi:MAG: DUF4832 domain-containing protein [Pseudomonadota bacterium]
MTAKTWRFGVMAAALCLCGNGAPRATATFQPTQEDFANPERGFYKPIGTDLANLTEHEVSEAYAHGYRLLYAQINLEAYRDSDIPDAVLAELDAAFALARRGGIKLIVRAVYNDPHGETDYRDAKDAPLPRVLLHLAQLKPVWARNVDVIAFVQAGFVGAWGEWHTSSNDLASPGNRDQIMRGLLDAAPASRFVQFRDPRYIQGWVPVAPLPPAALSTNFRIGFHNDCFMASATDVGTFDTDPKARAAQQHYVDLLGDVAPVGGETCNASDEQGAAPRTSCAAIRNEGRRYNLTYLNDSYYRQAFHERWIAEGCMAEVRQKMGYRIELVRATHPAHSVPGARMTLDMVVRNTGWARIFNRRAVEILLRDPASGRVRRISASGADPRSWTPGRDSAASLALALPDDLAAGTYELWFALPDPDRRLAGDPRYAIRVANADDQAHGQRWDAVLGAFDLGTTVAIR